MSGVYTNTDINKVRSIFFNNKNSMTDMDLLMIGSTPVSAVTPKLQEEEIAYKNGDLDLSRSDGNLYFQSREMSYTFVFVSALNPNQSTIKYNLDITDKIRAVQEWLYDYSNTVPGTWTATYNSNSYTMDRKDMIDTGYTLKFQNVRVESIEVAKGMFNDVWLDQITVKFKMDPEMVSRNAHIIDITTFGDRALSGRRFTGTEHWSTTNTNVKPQTIMTFYMQNVGISGTAKTYWMNDFGELKYDHNMEPVSDTHIFNYIIEVPYEGKIGMYIDPIAYDPSTSQSYEIDSVTWGSGSGLVSGTLYFLDNENPGSYVTSHKGGYLITESKGWHGKRIVDLLVTFTESYTPPGGSSDDTSWLPRIYFEWGPLVDLPAGVDMGSVILRCKGYSGSPTNDSCATMNDVYIWNAAERYGVCMLLDQPINVLNARSKNYNKLWTLDKGSTSGVIRGL